MSQLTINNYTEAISSFKRESNFARLKIAELLITAEATSEIERAGYDGLNAYGSEPEVSLRHYEIKKITEVYKAFYALGFSLEKMAEYDMDKLYLIARIVDKDNVEEWLSTIKLLRFNDIKKELCETFEIDFDELTGEKLISCPKCFHSFPERMLFR